MTYHILLGLTSASLRATCHAILLSDSNPLASMWGGTQFRICARSDILKRASLLTVRERDGPVDNLCEGEEFPMRLLRVRHARRLIQDMCNVLIQINTKPITSCASGRFIYFSSPGVFTALATQYFAKKDPLSLGQWPFRIMNAAGAYASFFGARQAELQLFWNIGGRWGPGVVVGLSWT